MNIIKDLKSFASKVESAFKKLFGNSATWIEIAQGVLTYAGPVLITAVSVEGGAPAGSAVSAVLSVIKTDLATALAALTSANAATTVPGLLASIQSNLPALLAAIKVENPALVSKVEAAVSLLTPEIDALIAAMPAIIA